MVYIVLSKGELHKKINNLFMDSSEMNINKGNIEVDVDSYIWVKVLNYKGDNSWMLSKIIGEADSLLSTINIVNVRTTEGRLHNYLTDGEAFPKEAQPEKYFKVCIEGSSKTIVIPDNQIFKIEDMYFTEPDPEINLAEINKSQGPASPNMSSFKGSDDGKIKGSARSKLSEISCCFRPRPPGQPKESQPDPLINLIQEKVSNHFEKTVRQQRNIIEQKNEEIKMMNTIHEQEYNNYQQEIIRERNAKNNLKKENKNLIGNLLKFEYLINQITRIGGFKDQAEDIVEEFKNISIPEVSFKNEFVPTPESDIEENEPAQEIVEELESLGFSSNTSQRAAIATGNSNIEDAIDWCFDNHGLPDYDRQVPSQVSVDEEDGIPDIEGDFDYGIISNTQVEENGSIEENTEVTDISDDNYIINMDSTYNYSGNASQDQLPNNYYSRNYRELTVLEKLIIIYQVHNYSGCFSYWETIINYINKCREKNPSLQKVFEGINFGPPSGPGFLDLLKLISLKDIPIYNDLWKHWEDKYIIHFKPRSITPLGKPSTNNFLELPPGIRLIAKDVGSIKIKSGEVVDWDIGDHALILGTIMDIMDPLTRQIIPHYNIVIGLGGPFDTSETYQAIIPCEDIHDYNISGWEPDMLI